MVDGNPHSSKGHIGRNNPHAISREMRRESWYGSIPRDPWAEEEAFLQKRATSGQVETRKSWVGALVVCWVGGGDGMECGVVAFWVVKSGVVECGQVWWCGMVEWSEVE